MLIRRVALILGCLLVLAGALGPGAARPARAASTTLVINEIFNSNTVVPPGAQNEYIEIMNVGDTPIDVSANGGWFVYNKNGRDSLAGIPNPVIQPGEMRAIPATQLPGGDIGVGTIVSGVNIGLDTFADYVGLADAQGQASDAVNWGTLNPNWFGYNLFTAEYILDGPLPIPLPDTIRSLQRFPDGRDTNSYTDWAFISSSPGAPSCDDPYEDDDTLATARLFSTSSGTQTHRICGPGDQDWYGITMSAGYTYTLVVAPTGATLIATARLYGNNGVLLATGTPSGRGSYLSYRPLFSGGYYALVTGNGGASGDDWLYEVTLSNNSCGAFTDVPPGSPFYLFVHCLACRGILNGYTDPALCPSGVPCYRPQVDVTRGQIAKIVTNAAGWTNPIPVIQQTFADVPPTHLFWEGIEQLAVHNAISGYACGGPNEPCGPGNRPYFRPGNPATRGQIAKIVSLAAQIADPIPTTRQTFADVPASAPFWLWIEQLAGRQILSGYLCGGPSEPCDPALRPYFRPGANVTRGQLAKIVATLFFPNCPTLVQR